ncbi:MAG: hypothetical protein GY754_42460 [bacterium]|nr:hypothetical protein [bacterium]
MKKIFILLVVCVIGFSACEAGLVAGDSSENSDSGFSFSDIYNKMVPVGTIMAWHKNGAGSSAVDFLSNNWVECNGQTIYDFGSHWNGKTVPDLNSSGRFLRGASTSGVFQEDATAVNGLFMGLGGEHTHTVSDRHSGHDGYTPEDVDSGGSNESGKNYYYTTRTTSESGSHDHALDSGDTETRPANMSVVWIIRIK